MKRHAVLEGKNGRGLPGPEEAKDEGNRNGRRETSSACVLFCHGSVRKIGDRQTPTPIEVIVVRATKRRRPSPCYTEEPNKLKMPFPFHAMSVIGVARKSLYIIYVSPVPVHAPPPLLQQSHAVRGSREVCFFRSLRIRENGERNAIII